MENQLHVSFHKQEWLELYTFFKLIFHFVGQLLPMIESYLVIRWYCKNQHRLTISFIVAEGANMGDMAVALFRL